LIVPPFAGGIGSEVCGGPLATGSLPVLLLDKSLLLQPASTQINTAGKKNGSLSLLNIFLQIIRPGWGLVRITWQLLARHSIFTFDPTAEVNELAALRTEWTEGVVFPLGWFPAGWALHES
jgi:hypothetical protein